VSNFNPFGNDSLGWWADTSMLIGIFCGIVIYFLGWGLFIASPLVLVYQVFFK
jgi:hypothetical protein